VIIIAALFFIPIGLFSLRQAILTPVGRLLNAMKRVQSGDWGSRVDTVKGSDEFRMLSRSFNSMMDEIQALRVNVFEEQLMKQKEELQRLQLQMNPHFFLNSLNIVYNLAKIQNYKLIMEMTMALIQFFRYLFRSNTTFVKLKEELQHTQNYLKIQALRFPDKLSWHIDAPEYLLEVPVPPLVIQTFVENAIKHGITMEEPIEIRIEAGFVDELSGKEFMIRIEDTGPGFSQDVLELLRAGKSVENALGEHTGIWNVQRRLGLLYGPDASVYFDNAHENGGARVVIKLPIHPNVEVIA
jgi:two-component system sensor histidine kinase YesM